MKKKVLTLVLVCLILVLLIFSLIYIFDNFCIIDGDSMFPTLKNNQICKIHKKQNVELNSIVVFEFQNNLMVKRVIGMENDIIVVSNKGIYRNSELIISCDLDTVEVKTIVGKEQIFVVGDNLLKSIDSRERGCIDIKNVIGIIYAK